MQIYEILSVKANGSSHLCQKSAATCFSLSRRSEAEQKSSEPDLSSSLQKALPANAVAADRGEAARRLARSRKLALAASLAGHEHTELLELAKDAEFCLGRNTVDDLRHRP